MTDATAAAPPPQHDAAPTEQVSLRGDVTTAVRNTLKLGASLLGTWVVGLGIRMMLPRLMGPAAFGELQFADAFTIVIMMTTTLGIDTYIRREIPLRREHASEFFGSTMLVSLGVGALVLLMALPALHAAGKSPLILSLVLIFGLAQIVVNLSNNLASLLHAVGNVDGLSIQNVVSKLIWGGGIAFAFLLGYGARGVAFAMLASELVKLAAMFRLARKHVPLRLHYRAAAIKPVLVASAPFFLLTLAQTIYSRIDVSIMSFLANDMEVGWYGAASTLAGVSLLLSPLIGWVVLPLTQRAAARSHDEFLLVSRRVLELVMTFAFPVTLAFYVSAPVIIPLAFGDAFRPSIAALKILAPTFVLTYAAIVGSALLIRMGRGWLATWISIGSMVLSPMLNFFFLPRFQAHFGVGGAGMGAAFCLSLTELIAATAILWSLGREFAERRTIIVMAKTMLIGITVGALDHIIPLPDIPRILLDGVLYLGACLATGALDVQQIVQLGRAAMAERAQSAAEPIA
jgi:O-antigen/teichoic acid export membrane protein